MITRLSIQWFKWLADGDYELWQDTIITWKNWAWKSRIIEAIIYCLTWEVQWYKKKIKDCAISISWNWFSLQRVNWVATWNWIPQDPQKFLCSIVPWYINSLTIKDKIRILTWTNENNLWFGWGVRSYESYKSLNSEYKKLKKLVEEMSEEIIGNMIIINETEDSNIWNLIELKERHDLIIKHKLAIEENKWIQEIVDLRKKRIAELKTLLIWFDHEADIYSIRWLINNRIDDYNKLLILREEHKIKQTQLAWGQCFTCGQSLTNEELLTQSKLETKRIAKDIKDFSILEVKKELKNINKGIVEFEDKLKLYRELWALESIADNFKVIEDITYTEEELETLVLKLSNYEELYSKSEQRKLLVKRNKLLEDRIQEANITKMESNLTAFEEWEKNHYINSERLFATAWFNIKLYKSNSSTDWGQLTYEISKDWIDYFWLSSGQQLLIDAKISLIIGENYNTWYMLIDNWERLSNDNFKKILTLLWDKQIIITKVSQGNLELQID